MQTGGDPVWDQTMIDRLRFWPRPAFLGEVKQNQAEG